MTRFSLSLARVLAEVGNFQGYSMIVGLIMGKINAKRQHTATIGTSQSTKRGSVAKRSIVLFFF